MSLNWDHFRFFLALARTGSLAAAGDRESVSHSTVFRRVRRFEAELDTKLFDRTPSGWTLTAAGTRVLLEAERMEAGIQAISHGVGGQDGQVAGPITLAVGEAVALTVLPKVVRTIVDMHPGLQFDLRIGRDLVDIEQRDADLAIRFSMAPPEALIGRRLGQAGLVPCAAPAYIESHGIAYPALAVGHRFLVVRSARPSRWADLRLDAHPEAVLFVDCFVTATELCRAGLGITEIPDFVVDTDPELVRLTGAPRRPAVPAWLLMHPDLKDVARIRTAADALYAGLRPVLGAPSGN